MKRAVFTLWLLLAAVAATGAKRAYATRIRIQRPATAYSGRLHRHAAAPAPRTDGECAPCTAGRLLRVEPRDRGARTENRAPQLDAQFQAQRQLQLRIVGHLQPELSGQQHPDMDDDHDRARAKLVERRGFALDPARRDFQPPQQDQAAEEAYREYPVRPRPLVRRVAHEDHRRLHHGRRAALDPAERRRSQDHVRGTIPHDRSGLRQRQGSTRRR